MKFAKRAFDIVGASIGLALMGPPSLAIAFYRSVTTEQPLIFRQERTGLNKKPFTILKFQTMSEAHDSSGKALPIEQRVDKVGEFLRRTKLDEVPQFINVLDGSMSLVGPRPDTNYNYIISNDAKRYVVKPGMTGLAQLKGLNNLSNEVRLKYDHKYVDTNSLLLDIKLCFMTAGSILKNWKAPHYNKEHDLIDKKLQKHTP